MSDRMTAGARTRREGEIRAMMAQVFRLHKEARDALEKRLAEGQLLNAFSLRPVLKAQADMLPWARVTRGMKDSNLGLYQAMLEVREVCVRTLLEFGEATSTDLIALDVDRQEREGMRRFVRATARFISPPSTGTVSTARGMDTVEPTVTETPASDE
jgi:hypothetical protein